MAAQKTGPPALHDYSEVAVGKAVSGVVMSHPVTVYPTALGILGVAAGSLLVIPEAAYAGLAGIVIGVGSLIVNYFFRHGTYAKKYLADLREAQRAHLAARPERLRQEFRELSFERGEQQLDALKRQFEALQQVLNAQLNPTELTYNRYLGTAEQVYLAALDSLQAGVRQLRSIQSLEPRTIQKQLTQAKSDDERRTLTERLAIITGVEQAVADIVTDTEEAVTALAKTAISIASIETQAGQATMDYETAIAELTSLANRAHIYDRNK